MNESVHCTLDDRTGCKLINGTGQRWRHGRTQPSLRIPKCVPEWPAEAMYRGMLRERVIESLTCMDSKQCVDVHQLPETIDAVRVLKQMNCDVKHLICG